MDVLIFCIFLFNVASSICDAMLFTCLCRVQQTTQVKNRFALVRRPVMAMAACHVVFHFDTALQFAPQVFSRIEPWRQKEGEKEPSMVCMLLGMVLQFTGVGDFMWAVVLGSTLLVLLFGVSSAEVNARAWMHHTLAWGVGAILAVVPLWMHKYGWEPKERECWINSPNERVALFYAVALATFGFHAFVLILTAWRYRAHGRRSLRQMVIFLTYFALVWSLPISIRVAKGDSQPDWLMKARQVCMSLYGCGNCLLWYSVMRKMSRVQQEAGRFENETRELVAKARRNGKARGTGEPEDQDDIQAAIAAYERRAMYGSSTATFVDSQDSQDVGGQPSVKEPTVTRTPEARGGGIPPVMSFQPSSMHYSRNAARGWVQVQEYDDDYVGVSRESSGRFLSKSRI